VLLIEHDMDLVFSFADRISVLVNGALFTEGTVEDRIAEMLASKRALADAILGSGESALTELTDRELSDLVSLRRTS